MRPGGNPTSAASTAVSGGTRSWDDEAGVTAASRAAQVEAEFGALQSLTEILLFTRCARFVIQLTDINKK